MRTSVDPIDIKSQWAKVIIETEPTSKEQAKLYKTTYKLCRKLWSDWELCHAYEAVYNVNAATAMEALEANKEKW